MRTGARGVTLAKFLFRVSTFAAASVLALGLIALGSADAVTSPHPGLSSRPSAPPAITVAAMSRPESEDQLADDAAAAGETGRVTGGFAGRPVRPPAYRSPPPQALAPPDEEFTAPPSPEDDGYDPLYGAGAAPERPYPQARRHARPVRRHHRTERPAAEAPRHAAAKTPPAPPAPKPAPAKPVHPHRMHIIVEPPSRPSLAPPEQMTPVTPDLPEVQAQPAPAEDLQSRLDQLTRVAVADMHGATLTASAPSAGPEGAVTLTLPAQLFGDLGQKAEELGIGPAVRDMTVSVRLTGPGYDVGSPRMLSEAGEDGTPATFVWPVASSSDDRGALTAEVTAVLDVDGGTQTLSFGTLTLQPPPPPASVPAPPPPVSQPAPAPDLRAKLLTRLDPRRFKLHDLAIPGRPTLVVPMLGPVASEKVVAAGLVLLALLMLRALFRGPRRRFEDFEYGG